MTTPRRIILAVVVLGGVIVAYWLVSPLFITRRIAEELPIAPASTPTFFPSKSEGEQLVPRSPTGGVGEGEAESPVELSGPKDLARGTFEGLAGHRAQGTARLIEAEEKRYVRFESDFRVTNGPDLFVYLGRNGVYDPNARLSALKGNEGSQNYEIPSGFDLASYDAVWVWCRAFSVPFGKATLASVASGG